MTWDGVDRRSQERICPLHNRLETKIDLFMERQQVNAVELTHIRNTIENGLKDNLIEVKKIVKNLVIKVETLERFSPIAEWIIKSRDNLFKNVLRVAFGGGFIFACIVGAIYLAIKIVGKNG